MGAKSKYGGLPESSSTTVQPKLQMSQALVGAVGGKGWGEGMRR